jgi:UDP-2,4-diacetamido-2,4,6-trideoxy-beta-L-altropyranose hydrolase
MKIAFRVDSADSIGAGHIRRCLKLAEDLKNKSKKIYFITKNLSGNFNKLIDKKKFKVILIKNLSSDWKSTKLICKKFKINILIVDHYQLGKNREKKIKKKVDKLVADEDFSKKKHHCDLIINNFNKKKNDNTKHYTGLEYIIIPSQVLPKKIKNKKKRKFIKIGTFFGSSDNNNFTEKFLKIFANKEFDNFKFISILGKNNINKEKIKIDFKKYKNLNLVKSFKNIENFFEQIDILISPGSVISYEALCNNIKCINVPLNFYQKMSSNFQQKNKIANTLSFKKIFKKDGKKILIKLLKKESKRNNFL